jgi:hypothetical protein
MCCSSQGGLGRHKARVTGPQDSGREGTIYQRKDGSYEGAAFVPATAGTVRRVRVCGRTREDVRRQLTKILEQADRGIPVAAVSWAIAKYPVYRLGHGVRPERKPRTCQGYEGVAPDVKLVRQRPMAVVAAGQVAVVAPPATS